MAGLVWLEKMSDWVWGPPMMVLLLGTGVYVTLILTGIQFRGFRHALAILLGRYDDPSSAGEVSHFRALATALSATIGTGNIVGVAAALTLGGPGAVFWMWMTALFGMATKFTSCTLAVAFRRVDPDGHVHAGPMHYIERGLGRRWRWMAAAFACFTLISSLGIGNMFQVNNIVTAAYRLLQPSGTDRGSVLVFNGALGAALACLTAVIIVGGIRRIAWWAARLVPFMCVFYLVLSAWILLSHIHLVWPVMTMIIHDAFHAPEAVSGGLIAGVIRQGVARGLFSNEAGLGSAPIAHGAAKTDEPVREGLVAMLGPFIDTIIVCSLTAFVILISGIEWASADASQLTARAFDHLLPGFGWTVSVAIILFAFSTLISWSYYGDRAADYLFGTKGVFYYRWTYVGFVWLGAIHHLDDVIRFSDVCNGLMALPNLAALIMLAPYVKRLTTDYFHRIKH